MAGHGADEGDARPPVVWPLSVIVCLVAHPAHCRPARIVLFAMVAGIEARVAAGLWGARSP